MHFQFLNVVNMNKTFIANEDRVSKQNQYLLKHASLWELYAAALNP